MANQNFVVHNGLTVGALTIDAATSNVALPVGKQILIGNVLLRDNGDGRLAVRDKTDNSDAIIVATIDAPSVTQGNIQIGTNHIESVNSNGPISLRPNGSGNLAFSSNTIMFGHGAAYTLIGTGIQTDPAYGINYPGSNVIMTLSDINSSGNLRLSMTTAATSTVTGALQVAGGVGVVGAVLAGQLNSTGNVVATGGVFNALTVNGTTNTQGVVPLASNTYSVGSSTLWYSNFWGRSVNAAYADLAEKYLADEQYEPGTVLMFGGEFEVTECSHDMCTAVAGVVSTNPAYLMNHQIQGDNVVDLALTGRVPTKVTGLVKKGDMMVSAGNGRARSEANPRVGSVIGKALENFDGLEGVIEVVIGRN